MSHVISRGLAFAFAVAPLLVACGGKADSPGPINSTQCSGSNCPVQGPPPQGAGAASLCPATADIVKNTYLGGAGSGEIVSLNIDATAMTYKLTWLESPIPTQAGQVQPTRQGVALSGAVAHPPAGVLPTEEQTRCAFILQPSQGTVPADGSTYNTSSVFNQNNPPMILVGQGGVAGGGIPGAEVSFAGVPNPLDPSGTIFAVPDRKFDFYPFIGFATTDNNLADLQGTYNALAYHIRPSDDYGALGTTAVETFDASGNCTSPTACITTGGPATNGTGWAPVSSGGYFTSTNVPQLLPSPTVDVLGVPVITFHSISPGYLVLGKVNGATVPIVVRTGIANPSNLQVDDESGIAMLAPATAIASGSINGGYAGADSNFKYTATLLQDDVGTFINPSTSAAESGFGLQYGVSSPGLVNVVDPQSGATGYVIASGGLYAVLLQGVENGGIAPSSAIVGQPTSSAPYFGIGAQVNK